MEYLPVKRALSVCARARMHVVCVCAHICAHTHSTTHAVCVCAHVRACVLQMYS